MRRLAAFGILLLLVGLSTAFAASFGVQSEDIATFTTDVSISVPTTTTTTAPPPVPFPGLVYVRGPADTGVGSLDFTAPANNDHVTQRLLVLSTEPVELQTTVSKYLTWKSAPAPAQGFLLSGSVTLHIEQKGGGANRITAALLVCPTNAPAATTTAAPNPCQLVRAGTAAAVTGSEGYTERSVSFGSVNVSIPAGQELRLKVVNRANDGQVLSTEDVDMQWGYLPSRESRLVITTP